MKQELITINKTRIDTMQITHDAAILHLITSKNKNKNKWQGRKREVRN